MHDQQSTSRLLAELTPNDQGAFAELFSQHSGRLKQMLARQIDRRLQVRADLSDVVQEVYIEAFKRIEHYLKNPEYSFYVWLRQIALQRLIDIHREHVLAKKRSVRSEVPIARPQNNLTASHAWAVELVAQQASPSHAAMHDEMIVRVEATLENMDPMDREILALRHFEEMKNAEVAEVLGISVAAASNRYVRALRRLRKSLTDFSDLDESR